MATKFTLPEEAKICPVLKPATDAAGRTSVYINTKTGHKLYFLVYLDQGNAATVAITIQQATDGSGTGTKVITGNARIWANQDVVATDTLVRAADGVSFTTSAGVKQKLVVIEIDPATLDQANAFTWVAILTGASNVANLTSAIALLTPIRYPGATPPSAIL